MNSIHLMRFLVFLVGISGFSQGMLLPTLLLFLKKTELVLFKRASCNWNLYWGFACFSVNGGSTEKYGYKPMILVGGISVIISLALFPVWKSFWFWFVLRLIVGIGDHTLHFATQTWITDMSPIAKRGRNISIYGLFFSLGFMVGPLMTKLLEINEGFAFIVTSLFSLVTWSMVFFVRNAVPERGR